MTGLAPNYGCYPGSRIIRKNNYEESNGLLTPSRFLFVKCVYIMVIMITESPKGARKEDLTRFSRTVGGHPVH